ncbi:hypothetical protein QQF64_020322, partial [Cirrhinus molitorella]
ADPAIQSQRRALDCFPSVMSSSSGPLNDELQCSICLDVFTDPVTTPCGHNFCRTCLNKHWTNTQTCFCPFCKETFSRRPDLKINTTLREVVQHFKVKLKRGRSEVFCDICDERKQKAMKSCLTCPSSYCETHLEPHLRVPRLKKHKLINAVENLEDYICQKHERPLELFCRDDQTCVCLSCTEGDHRTHNTVPIEDESQQKKNQLVQTQTDVQQMIQNRMKKIQENEHSVEMRKRNTEKEKSSSVELFTDLIHSIERCQSELLKMMEEQQRAAEKQAEDLIKELQQEITDLKRRNTELEQLSHTDDHLHLIQLFSSMCSHPHMKNWTEINTNSSMDVLPMNRALTQLKKTLDGILNEKLLQSGLKWAQKFAVDVTLDPDTANPKLILSDDGKQVSRGDIKQDVPENPKRFGFGCVLAKQGFSSGKFYYEVQVKGKTKWYLGVARESINRKNQKTLTTVHGFWTLILRNENQYTACDNPPVSLSLKVKPEKVGVFVNYEEGLVSFYDVGSNSHIYSFTGQTFTEKLYPYFGPGLKDEVMASSSGPLNEELQCSICLDVFTDPVTTPCGHNFCRTCLNKHWTNTQTCFCPLCKETFSRKTDLKINTTLREVVQHFKVKLKRGRSEVFCDICDERKQKAMKSCLTCPSSYCETHLEPHLRVPRLKKHKLINAVENLEDYICQKHERPLELFCRDDQTCVCLSCTEGDHRTHNTVPIEEESQQKKNQLVQTQTDVQQMIQNRMKKIQEIEHSVEMRKRNTEKEKSSSVELFTDLIRSIERCQSELLKMMEEQQKAAEKQAEYLIKELQQETTDLKRRNTELEQLSHTDDHLHLIQMFSSLSSHPHTKNWTEISIDSNVDGLHMNTALVQFKKTLDETLDEILIQNLEKQTLDVTLDPDTANPKLILSDDGKQVSRGDIKQDVPENPKRFGFGCVLAKQGFRSGKFYYEVQVKGKTKWYLGVARESINRKNQKTLTTVHGFWTLILRNENQYTACDNPPVSLSLKVKPEKVGVFVNYEEGLVSFYDVGSNSHIYSFTGQTFTEKLYPYFGPGLKDEVMASSSGPLNEELQCSICLDVFTDPVTTPCGHNFCRTCLNKHWTNTQTCFCPLCKETFSRKTDLKINTTLREVVQHFKVKLKRGRSEVFCDICDERKQKAMKSCLTCPSSYCETHLEPHLRVPRLKKHKLINAVENLEDYICQKHERPLELFCRDDQTCVCLSCTEGDHRTHNTVPIEEESQQKKNQLVQTQTDVQQMIQNRMKKIQEIEHSVEMRKRNTEKEKSPSVELFTDLIRSIERCQSELLKMMEEQQKAAEKQAEYLIKELQQETTDLKRRNTELEQLSHTDDHLHLIQMFSSLSSHPHTKNRTEISIDSNVDGLHMNTALVQFKKTLDETLDEILIQSELKYVQTFSVDVTLDPDTANPYLILSDDGKQCEEVQEVRMVGYPLLTPPTPRKLVPGSWSGAPAWRGWLPPSCPVDGLSQVLRFRQSQMTFLRVGGESSLPELRQHPLQMVQVFFPCLRVNDDVIQVGCGIGLVRPQQDVHKTLKCGTMEGEGKGPGTASGH